ncbi:nitroreductase family protein [Nocardia alba]|uniref:Nitroreductase n=1 Tax=Nocardia alba TaxID=225051 RepID=A0A4R1FRV5_9NOCA|nr:nitroreductase family protein [Nocardia alba]TCJ96950.1 nitroreductase [Nocardia alba]
MRYRRGHIAPGSLVALKMPDRDRLHPLLAGRFSPRAFHPSEIDDATVDLLLEAARWAPSAGNSQPWGFFPVRPHETEYDRVVRHLAPSSATWALDASLLIVTLARRFLDDGVLPYSEFADYDLGQAVAHLTIQAQALDLATHQFRAFDLESLTKELDPNPGWTIMSIIAVGPPADPCPATTRNPLPHLRTAPWTAR